MDHVIVRRLDHLTGKAERPDLGYAVETRDRPGPAFKGGTDPGEVVWVQLQGGLIVARAEIELGWVAEYAGIEEVRRQTRGSTLHDMEDFWKGRPRVGYAVVAELRRERWIEPFWAGPRSYGYEWILLENEKKHSTWLEPRDPPRGGQALERDIQAWKASHP